MATCHRFLVLSLALIGVSLAAPETQAQIRPHVTLTPEELLSAFVRESQLPPGTSSTASLTLTAVLIHYPDYPAAWRRGAPPRPGTDRFDGRLVKVA